MKNTIALTAIAAIAAAASAQNIIVTATKTQIRFR